MTRVLAIGECMLELIHREQGILALGYAGDTYNTAVYLSRLTDPRDVQVDYLTLVGDDEYSERMLRAMEAEGVGTARIRRVPGSRPGLYLVRTDDDGERHFCYYRSESAARGMFAEEEPPPTWLAEYDVVYLSGVTLQVLTPPARERLWGWLRQIRMDGGQVLFDSNYRSAGWPDAATARDAIRTTWALATTALPTFGDERALFADAAPTDAAFRLRSWGVAEVVVKNGSDGCWVSNPECHQHVPVQPVTGIVDTTAAGDAFNAGYLAARIAGMDALGAVGRGHDVASLVIRRRGAIVDDDALPRRRDAGFAASPRS